MDNLFDKKLFSNNLFIRYLIFLIFYSSKNRKYNNYLISQFKKYENYEYINQKKKKKKMENRNFMYKNYSTEKHLYHFCIKIFIYQIK